MNRYKQKFANIKIKKVQAGKKSYIKPSGKVKLDYTTRNAFNAPVPKTTITVAQKKKLIKKTLTEEEYIHKFYQLNKAKINRNFTAEFEGMEEYLNASYNTQYSIEERFVNQFKDLRKERKTSLKETAKYIVEHTTLIQNYKDIFSNNVVKALKGANKWNQFRELTKDEKGRYTTFDINKLSYEGDSIYKYDSSQGVITISFMNSPQDIEVYI